MKITLWLRVLLVGSLFHLMPAGRARAQSTNAPNPPTVPARSALTMGGIVTTPERKASPKLAAPGLPVPPAQAQPWTPGNATLPAAYVSATRALFDAGLADPRGGEYRDIEIGTGSPWTGDGGVIPTRGWVLPGQGAPQFAVCWNGLVYPVVSVGAAADWQADTREAIRRGGRSWRSAGNEGVTTSASALFPLKGCLLLRLGAADLAREFWGAIQQGGPGVAATNAPPRAVIILPETDPYLEWARDWTWTMFERAVCAHMRGDDRLALADARALARIQPVIEQEAAARGFQKDRTFFSTGNGREPHFLSFLEPLPRLLADQERRAARPKTQTVLQTGLDRFPNQAARIAALVEDLDEVAQRQWGQPGGLNNWEWSPVVAALLKEGAAAVEPLLQFLEAGGGTRLTRSVSFGRDFHRGRDLRPVYQPAAVAVLQILGINAATLGYGGGVHYGAALPDGFVAAVRAYRGKLGALSPAEQWYQTLQDPQSSQTQWEAAIGNIVADEKAVAPAAATNAPPRLRGESLRAKSNPTVTELLLQRAKLWKPRHPGSTFEIGERVGFLGLLARWDGPAALPLLQQSMQEHLATFQKHSSTNASPNLSQHYLNHPFPGAAAALVRLTEDRFRAGDAAALEEYSQWIRQLRAEHYAVWLEGRYGLANANLLEPLWLFADQPAMREAAREIFSRPDSPWLGLEWLPGWPVQQRALVWEALTIPGAHEAVRRGLTNVTLVIEATVQPNGQVALNQPPGGRHTIGSVNLQETPVGTALNIRRCDVVATCLAGIPGFPAVNRFWPDDRRRAAVEKTRECWDRYETKLRLTAPLRASARSSGAPAIRIEFPVRTLPATGADVARGDAIFQLDGLAETRRVPLPRTPMPAIWPVGSRQPVLVWQAEEGARDGKVERFFGIVAPQEIVRVPGLELEFPPERGFEWTVLSNRLGCQITGLGASARGLPRARANVGEPLPLTVLVDNLSGLEPLVPVGWLRGGADRALAPGIELRLAFAPAPADAPKLTGGPDSAGPRLPSPASWRDVKPKPSAAITALPPARRLGLAEQMEAAQLDLNDWFEITTPGCYRFQLLFTGSATPALQGQSLPMYFQLGAAPDGKR